MVCRISPANRQNPPIKEPQQGARSNPPKLHFRALAPTAEFFWVMRINPVSPGLPGQFGGQDDDNGMGRFGAAPRRQHLMIPPEDRQTFPFREFT